MRKLNDRTVITEAIQSAVQQEIENFLQTNFQTLNQELLDDIYNDELAREVEEQLRYPDLLRELQEEEEAEDDDDDYEEEDEDDDANVALKELNAFVISWVRDALTPTVADHLNAVFCRKGYEGFESCEDRADRIRFRGAPDTVHWIVRAKASEKDPALGGEYPEILREFIPELFDRPSAAD